MTKNIFPKGKAQNEITTNHPKYNKTLSNQISSLYQCQETTWNTVLHSPGSTHAALWQQTGPLDLCSSLLPAERRWCYAAFTWCGKDYPFHLWNGNCCRSEMKHGPTDPHLLLLKRLSHLHSLCIKIFYGLSSGNYDMRGYSFNFQVGFWYLP